MNEYVKQFIEEHIQFIENEQWDWVWLQHLLNWISILV